MARKRPGHKDLGAARHVWVPVEGKPQSPGTFITNAAIRDYIEGMKAKHVYLVADSCFSGTLFGRARAMPPLNDKFFATLYANKSRWGLTSGGAEPVADAGKGGHSIFAYHLIKLLKENSEPYLVPSHIFDQIAPLITNNAEQTPRSELIRNTATRAGSSCSAWRWARRRVAHCFDAMPVQVENKGGIVVGMVLRAQFRRPVIPATGSECGCMKGVPGPRLSDPHAVGQRTGVYRPVAPAVSDPVGDCTVVY